METIHSLCRYRHPVWAVSHAGHCAPPDGMDMLQGKALSPRCSTGCRPSCHSPVAASAPPAEHPRSARSCPGAAEDGDVFGLSGQVEHKLAFIRTHVPTATSLVLVGHSIGCYVILEMMKRSPDLKVGQRAWSLPVEAADLTCSSLVCVSSLQVAKAVLLFPTIERMAQSPQGRLLTPVLSHFRYLAYLPVFLLSLLPEGLKACLVRLVLAGIASLDQTVIQPAVELLSGDCAGSLPLSASSNGPLQLREMQALQKSEHRPLGAWLLGRVTLVTAACCSRFLMPPLLCAANAMYMAAQEMDEVVERDSRTIGRHLGKVRSLPR